MKKVMVGIGMMVFLAACASKDPVVATKVEDRTPVIPPRTTDTVKTGGTDSIKPPIGRPGDELKNPNSILSKRVVYFDFDTDAVKPEFYGKAVTLTGKLDGDSVHVEKISE